MDTSATPQPRAFSARISRSARVPTGTFNHNTGTVTTPQLVVGHAPAASVGTYNLNGGTLITGSVSTGGAASLSTFNFSGGTLQASAASAAFFQGLDAANRRSREIKEKNAEELLNTTSVP